MTGIDPIISAFHEAMSASTSTWCSACVRVLDIDAAAVVMIPASGHPEVFCSSDATAADVEDIQIMLGQGPAFAAHDAGHPILVPDVAVRDSRWPIFPTAMAERPHAARVGAMFSLPLQVGAIRVGVLDLFRKAHGPLETLQYSAALRVAETVTVALLGSATRVGADGTGSLILNRMINQATGMLIAQLGVGPQEAYLRLRAHAYSVNRPVSEIAGDIVDRRLRLDGPHDEADHR
ncbi:ANTAR domain-containing protein [Antrihabitans stalactiti]|uniref:GAF and ANTAR domain-containing protein n=1 Tax=Antrihabitans stalactiti TaxID=2584121 RepID=A0A848KMK7_9NOCA|nr:ANTAR domain-containing protein [Antrihabitans stalactiti]NMN98194.1 GAF and ANTAR domain-containing protein [Antrihabitans stalactiti]